jgi:ABC-type sulfate transport system permease component
MPLAIYLALESDLPAALALSTLLILVSASVLLGMRVFLRRGVLTTYA